MSRLLLIFLGGGLGAVLRYLVSVLARQMTRGRDAADEVDSLLALVPTGTLVVNVIGCFLIGLTMPLLGGLREEYRLALIVGLLGGFTTFSAFGHETVGMLDHGRMWLAGWYVLTSVGLGIVAVVCGHFLASRLVG